MKMRAFHDENEIEEAYALKTCNRLTGDILHSKLFLDDKNRLVVASEFFYRNEEDFEYLLRSVLQTIIAGKKRFFELYRPIEEVSKFLSNIEVSKFFSNNTGNI